MLLRVARICGVALLFVLAVVTIVLWRDPQLRHELWADWSYDIGEPDKSVPAAPLSKNGLATRFAVIGDFGTGDEEAQRTAEVMARLDARRDFDAVIMLGDNVYPNGDPELVDEVVLEPLEDTLDDDTKLLAALGNHDVRDGNGDGQVEALGLPGRWYATDFDQVLVITLDSTMADNSDQRTFLETTLAGSDARWKVAMMHHPPYSSGYHGSDDATRSAFVDLFERYGVDLVLAGHDHDYQRSEPIGSVTYVVSGASAKKRPAHRASFTEVAWSTFHLVDLAVYSNRLEGRAIDHEGRVFDQFILRN